MSFLAWIVLGLIAGIIGCKIVNKRGDGLILDIILGIVGAVVGGWVVGLLGYGGVSGLNLYSICVAVAGSVFVLLVYHAIRRVQQSFHARLRTPQLHRGADFPIRMLAHGGSVLTRNRHA